MSVLRSSEVDISRVPDEADDRSRISQNHTTLSVERSLQRQLQQVNRAIQALEDGTYGVCEDCEEPISERRLLAVPWATRCIKCQEAADGRL